MPTRKSGDSLVKRLDVEQRCGKLCDEKSEREVKILAKQSPKDRLRRLADGRCPIHGIHMHQVDNTELKGKHRFVAGCPRKDCKIQTTTHEPFGPGVLLPEFDHLLA